MGTPLEEPWAPEMHDVAEENTEDFASLKGVSEYSGNGATFRTGLHTEPSFHLTQVGPQHRGNHAHTQALLHVPATDP